MFFVASDLAGLRPFARSVPDRCSVPEPWQALDVVWPRPKGHPGAGIVREEPNVKTAQRGDEFGYCVAYLQISIPRFRDLRGRH
jgi:hypothetical protein